MFLVVLKYVSKVLSVAFKVNSLEEVLTYTVLLGAIVVAADLKAESSNFMYFSFDSNLPLCNSLSPIGNSGPPSIQYFIQFLRSSVDLHAAHSRAAQLLGDCYHSPGGNTLHIHRRTCGTAN